MRNRFLGALLALPALIVLGFFVYRLPPVNQRLAWRVDELRARVKYAFSPPDEAIFIPGGQNAPDSGTALPAPPVRTIIPTASPQPTRPPDDQIATATAEPTPEPTATLPPLPDSVALDGVVYVDQHNRWNYCGPSSLTMALNFWGWAGTRDDVARVVKPGVQDPSLDFIQQGRWDKNVMPYEMADFVSEQTDYNVVARHGGDIDMVKRLIAAGFPVLVEKGYFEADYTGKVAWLGHYLFTTGYDESAGEFIVQDAYLKPGKDMRVSYPEYIDGWRSFNYQFLVVYPPAREAEMFEALGSWGDPDWANRHALEVAERESQALDGIQGFFAWFNKGTSQVQLLQYAEASATYDTAFDLYSRLGDDENQRPYRIMWYQTGPYWAYYYSGRYQDVISLAETTLYDTISEPTLEESLYWRALALEALGDVDGALADLYESVRLNPNFTAGQFQLNRILGGG